MENANIRDERGGKKKKKEEKKKKEPRGTK